MSYKAEAKLSGVRELKLGKSFNKGCKDEAYHTIRYDFKPASVDSHKNGSLVVADKEITLTVPLAGGTGVTQEAVFKGNKTSASKDCLLIIDNVTGEMVLERISENIRVKKTRIEGSSKKVIPRAPEPKLKKATNQDHLNGSANHGSPAAKSPLSNRSQTNSKKNPTSNSGSMPMFNFEDEQKNESDSSSDSDSNSGSSSSSSDSDSDSEPEPSSKKYVQETSKVQEYPDHNQKSHTSPSILSDLELSEED